MPISFNNGIIWTPMVNVWVKVSGEWRPINKCQTRQAGVWVDVFGGDVDVSATVSVVQGSGWSGVRFQSDGGLDETGPGFDDTTAFASGEWRTDEPRASIGMNWRVRCVTINSGSFQSQAASVGTWVRMDGARTWAVLETMVAGAVDADFEIGPYPSGAAVASFNVILSAG